MFDNEVGNFNLNLTTYEFQGLRHTHHLTHVTLDACNCADARRIVLTWGETASAAFLSITQARHVPAIRTGLGTATTQLCTGWTRRALCCKEYQQLVNPSLDV